MLRRPVQYDALLRVRRLQEDLKAQIMAAARMDVDRAIRIRSDLLEERRTVFDAAGRCAHGRFDATEVRQYYQYERQVSRLIDDQDAEIVRLTAILDEKRMDLEAAMKQRRMVEKLRERRLQVYEAETRKEEQKLTDESATIRFAVARAPHDEARTGGMS